MNNKTYHFFFSNLSNPLRIKILLSLREKPKSVSELSEEINIEQSKLSHALASLRCCKIVVSEQKGKNRIYSLNRKTIVPMFKIIDDHAKIHCKGVCGNCKNVLE